MIEAELKYRVTRPNEVLSRLQTRGNASPDTYHDTYFDRRSPHSLSTDEELRVRTITSKERTTHLLTFKHSVVEAKSGSKNELETTVGDIATITEMLERLGFAPVLDFTKSCLNFRFNEGGADILATVVTVPEIGSETFLEIESLVDDEGAVPARLALLRTVALTLGLGNDELTNELYVDAVRAFRSHE